MPVSESQSIQAGEEITLSTGQTVSLPARTEATMAAAILPADREAVADLLPPGLSPIRAGWGTASVWLMSVAYHDIDDGALEPYNEFAVVIHAIPGKISGVPYVSPFRNSGGGYVWYMPVTHEPARAFGDEIWGYPKVVADIDIEETNGQMETTVTIDGDHFITLSVKRPWTFSREEDLTAYSRKDGTLQQIQLQLSGELGMWPYSRGVSVTLGDHPKARRLANLDFQDRAFVRQYADGQFVTSAPQPLNGLA